MDCMTDWQKLYEEHRQYYYSRRETIYGSDEFRHSSRYEYYDVYCREKNDHLSKDMHFSHAYYEGRFYYLKDRYVCVSDERGENIRILCELERGFDYIHVNVTGIYVYNYGIRSEDGSKLEVKHIDFEGRTIAESIDKFYINHQDYAASFLCFYDNRLYYVNEYKDFDPPNQQLKCMDVDTGKIRVIYDLASSIEGVLVGNNKVLFYARYDNDEKKESAYGWMMLDLKRGKTECIDRPYCNPEMLVIDPNTYEVDCFFENDKRAIVVAFNLHAGIYWIEVADGEGEFQRRTSTEGKSSSGRKYWVPIYLWGENQGKVVENMPIWRRAENFDSYGGVYFDGFYFYYFNSEYELISVNVFGEEQCWGRCSNMLYWNVSVWGGKYIFSDAGNYDTWRKQYVLSFSIPKALNYGCWLDGKMPLTQEVISQYRNSKYNLLNSSAAVSAEVVEPEQDFFFDFDVDDFFEPTPKSDVDDFFESTSKSDFDNFFNPTPKDYSELKIGKLAQTVFKDLLEAGKATEEEVRLMQQADYSKKTFDLQFPVLVRADDFFDSKRYYSKPLTIRGVQYMMCSQWFETAANNDRPYLMAWINKHS